jgi:hypothetical protein
VSGAASRDPREVLAALVAGAELSAVVPLALDLVERDPLLSTGRFPGDLLRGLMAVPGHLWGRHPWLYARYQAALRAGAVLRRQLPVEQRMAFWGALDATAHVHDPLVSRR